MTGPEAVSRSGGLLRHRDFLLLWTGQSVSDVGTAVSTVVFPLIAVVYLHASAFQVGVLAAAQWIAVAADRAAGRRLGRPVALPSADDRL